jgi:hypothetical protein
MATTTEMCHGSSLGEGGFFSSATKLDKRWEPDVEHREIVWSTIIFRKLL